MRRSVTPRTAHEHGTNATFLYSGPRDRSTARGHVARRLPGGHRSSSSARAERLVEEPEWDRFRLWLLESDRLLERVWGRMDRYHLAWLNVGRDSAPPGSALDEEGTHRFIVEVAGAKLAVLRTMRTSVERRGWTFLSDDPEQEATKEAR